jgi:esterase/lipase superfamily enzyme
VTLFLNFRAQSVGGPVIDPYVLQGDPLAAPDPTQAGLAAMGWPDVARLAQGKDVLFVAHGFNVNYVDGMLSAARLDQALGLGPDALFLGVLWPGDFWLPVVNYPFEGDVAIDCGRRLAKFCADWFADAASLSFASHSLGARVVLEAVKALQAPLKAKTVCVTAGAVNSDCLAAEYAAALANTAQNVTSLSSVGDHVLQLAFPLGDLVAVLLDDDHTPFTPALGYWGPKAPVPAGVRKTKIPPGLAYDHGNYMPPGAIAAGDQPDDRWRNVAQFIRNAFLGQPQAWPPAG